MLFVGIGGILGAIMRFQLGKWIAAKTSVAFPFGTFIINITGSFVLGFLAVLHLGKEISEWIWLLCGTGFLGAYTTFSTFGYETIQMLQKRETKNAALYVSISVFFGIIFAWVGSIIGIKI
ncbi:fluoride efflux transporter CrcB [Bacillus sp. AFS076308]|uniref:fluoride efflux transporter CrcB n=1 Tax=unclassified Bacillus (in: firmicutes) TaxID=185979 RepID=UPI000BF9871B|nr:MULTISPECIES: fluoride efflux transporter CrcB [unclassified Bacillus (in: firmicutes)]PFO08501.1 fluoride efflux transporter CrcB [Bacillus sp. AFS076308]PGV54686.1 fluoride efflux transporter CrcB [Bacillus sp. AFS037270]